MKDGSSGFVPKDKELIEMGRPRKPRPRGKLNPLAITRIVRALELGSTKEAAAHHAGIGMSTLKDWLRRGENEEGTMYRELYDKVEVARSAGCISLLEVIERAAEGCPAGCPVEHEHRGGVWQAAAWKLERINPSMYGKKRLEITGANNGPVQFAIKWDDTGAEDEKPEANDDL